MKTASDPRHQERISRVQALFALSYNTEPDEKIASIVPHLAEIDQKITAAAPEWPLSQINRVDLAILRQATYELMYDQTTPVKVVIDEAVEIGKTYGADNTPSFVNGVLGTIHKELTK